MKKRVALPHVVDAIRWERGDRVTVTPWRGGNVTARAVDGQRVEERKPSLAHCGGDYDTVQFHPNARNRFRDVLRHDGHIVSQVMTNGAPHVSVRTSWAGYQLAKARHFGWIPVDVCPVRLLKFGGFKPSVFLDESILKAHVCAKGATPEGGCKHFRAELAARRAKQIEAMTAIDAVIVDAESARERSIAEAAARAVALAIAPLLKGMKGAGE